MPGHHFTGPGTRLDRRLFSDNSPNCGHIPSTASTVPRTDMIWNMRNILTSRKEMRPTEK